MRVLADGVIMGFLAYCGRSDLKSRDIPVRIMILFSAGTVVLTVLCREEGWGSVAAGVALGLLFFGISKLTKEAIGYGDSWIITLLGIYLGGERLLWVLFIASMCAGIVSLFCLCKNGWKRDDTLPFVPYLVVAYLGVILV